MDGVGCSALPSQSWTFSALLSLVCLSFGSGWCVCWWKGRGQVACVVGFDFILEVLLPLWIICICIHIVKCLFNGLAVFQSFDIQIEWKWSYLNWLILSGCCAEILRILLCCLMPLVTPCLSMRQVVIYTSYRDDVSTDHIIDSNNGNLKDSLHQVIALLVMTLGIQFKLYMHFKLNHDTTAYLFSPFGFLFLPICIAFKR